MSTSDIVSQIKKDIGLNEDIRNVYNLIHNVLNCRDYVDRCYADLMDAEDDLRQCLVELDELGMTADELVIHFRDVEASRNK